MKHLGDFDASTVIYGKFTTYRPSTGAPFTLAGTPALSVYKDGSTTQSTTGVTLTVDFDSVTGLHHFAVDTSADGTFYSAGSFFSIVVTAGTVDSVSAVGTVAAEFTIRKNSALKPATAGRTLVVDAAGLADANTVKLGPSGSGTAQTARDIGASVLLSSGTGTGQLSFSSGILKVDVDTIKTNPVVNGGTITFPSGATLASTTNITAGTITTVTNVTNAPTAGDFTATMKTSIGTAVAASAVASVTGNVGGNVAGSVGSVVGTVTVGTNNDKTGYALSGTQTFNLTGNITGNLSGSAGSVTGLTASDVGAIKIKTDALPSNPADASDIAASFSTVNSALATLAAYVDTEIAAIKAKTDALTFTVAGKVDSNLLYVNGVQVAGTGETGDEWGPAP